MRALILAAGLGSRLDPEGKHVPKCLLQFGGRTLLERHLDLLDQAGVTEVVIALGHRSEAVERVIAAHVARHPDTRVTTVRNPRYRDGSVVTLHTLADALTAGGDILLMDADVLYDGRMLARLMLSRHPNCVLVDCNLDPGPEPVRVCVVDGRPVEFRKQADVPCDYMGESVGFFRLSAPTARCLAAQVAAYVADGRAAAPHEEALRDLMRGGGPEPFGVEDVTGLPWIEIDFPADVARARDAILPTLVADATAMKGCMP